MSARVQDVADRAADRTGAAGDDGNAALVEPGL
jgi:hypothetical protein